MLKHTLTLFTLHHVYLLRGCTIREVQIAAKNKRGARIAYGKRYHVGAFDCVYVYEAE